jgi:hypothetical protein
MKRKFHTLLTVALVVVATVSTVLSSQPAEQGWNGEYCIVREGYDPIVSPAVTRLYEHKLCVTKDEIARYVFLTNARGDGDRSAAIYHAPERARSLSGGYWVTSTEASDSFSAAIPTAVEKARVDLRKIKIRRTDAPLPASTAEVVHELWLTMLEKSRTFEKAVPSAPTFVISAKDHAGIHLKGVSASVGADTPCAQLLELGLWLVQYPHVPPQKRLDAAREIESAAQHLLQKSKKTRKVE